ncbi:tripartite tricarboxylate transporter substrate binding protein [Pseudorhodoferax sp. LjRoot39]|uniref:Bug family tripartite tricarboxylate transporter substrate binding protein n=1 Tax=Pseudorhodoferax sp. LjRoot39 TaxID=3342328 RepID=UPI003ECEEB5F
MHKTTPPLFQRRTLLQASGASIAASTWPAWAQDFPARPITVIVPYAAGGPTDVSARLLTEEMGRALGTQMLIDNRPSAGGIVAAGMVAKAAPDGYTLLLSVGTIVSTNPSLYSKLPYKVSDLAPIAQYARWPYVISAAPNLPVKSVADLVAYAKQRPEGVTFATVGQGTQSHIIAEWIARRLGIKIQTVPYKGVSQAVADLATGRVDLLTDGISTGVVNHQAGKLRILASMGEDRFFLPEGVGTFVDAGYPDLVAYSEFGLMAPAGTPDAVVKKLYGAMAATLGSAGVQARMRGRGEAPALSPSPQAYGDHIRQETVRWAELIKPLNVRLD